MATPTEAHNKLVVRRWVDEVLNLRSVVAVDGLGVSSSPGPSPYQEVDPRVSGAEAPPPEWLHGLPDIRFAVDGITAEGDVVVCHGHWQAPHPGRSREIGAAGQRLGGTRIDIFRVAGDAVVEHWGCGNEPASLELIGERRRDGDEAGGGSREHVARRFVEQVLGERDVAGLAELLDPHAVDRSNQAVTLLSLLVAFPDMEWCPVDVSRHGDTVVVESVVSGTQQGRFMGIEPTAKSVNGMRTDRFRIANGKIVECWADFDPRTLASQLGTPATATARPRVKGPACVGVARKAIVQRFMDDVLNRRNFASACSYFVDQPKDHFAGSLTTCLTLAGLPDFELATEHVVQDRSTVTVLAGLSGTHRGRVLGMPPTHRGVTGTVAMSFRTGWDGRFAETWMEIEPWTLLRQLDARATTGRQDLRPPVGIGAQHGARGGALEPAAPP